MKCLCSLASKTGRARVFRLRKSSAVSRKDTVQETKKLSFEQKPGRARVPLVPIELAKNVHATEGSCGGALSFAPADAANKHICPFGTSGTRPLPGFCFKPRIFRNFLNSALPDSSSQPDFSAASLLSRLKRANLCIYTAPNPGPNAARSEGPLLPDGVRRSPASRPANILM